jgi:hypothetical protein
LAGGAVPSLAGVLRGRLEKLDEQIQQLQDRRETLERFVATQDAMHGVGVDKAFMLSERERLELYALEHLERAPGAAGDGDGYASHLARELDCFNAVPETYALIPAIRRLLDFARQRAIPLGPGRGSAPASLLLHLMGLTKPDPVRWRLKPAVVFGVSRAIWIDVPYSSGKPVVELCEELSANLRPWKIEAFRMPLLDILDAVQERAGVRVDFDSVPDDSPEVLDLFARGDIEKIMWFDEPETTLAAKLYPEQLPEWAGHERVGEYLRSQTIVDFRDVLNVMALRRPRNGEFVGRMHEYAERKARCLAAAGSENGRTAATPGSADNFGMVVYHEDVIDLIERATPWDALAANRFRWSAFRRRLGDDDRAAFLEHGTSDQLAYIESVAPFAFSKAHVAAQADLVKRCAIVKSRWRDVYLDETKRFEDAHGLAWCDFGFHDAQVCLLK